MPRSRAALSISSASRAADRAASSIAGRSWRAGPESRVIVSPGDCVARSRQVSLLRCRLARLHDLQRYPLSLRAVHENPDRVLPGHGKCQVPQVDRDREDDVTGIGWTVCDHFARTGAHFRAVGGRDYKTESVLAVSLERGEPN